MTVQTQPTNPTSSELVPPISIRGVAHQQVKKFLSGTHRACPPSATLNAIRPYFGAAGISRLANITGLDRIGLPVILCIRPNSKSISCSAGKGLTLEASMVSGAMEGLELHAAEEVAPEILRVSYNELPRRYERIPYERLPIARHSVFHRDLPIDWLLGWDLISQQEVPVPYSFVCMSTPQNAYDLRCFQTSSNGLASGNNLLEACCAAICELVERDAVTCSGFRDRRGIRVPIDLQTISFPTVQELAAMLVDVAMVPFVFDRTSDIGVPTFEVRLYDRLFPESGAYIGYGCHLSPEIAMTRALTEAVQSRTVTISGSRDDFFHEHFHMMKRLQSADAHAALKFPERIPAKQYKDLSGQSFEEDIALLIAGLQNAKLNQVIVIPLESPAREVAIAKVVIPGLEGPTISEYAPGLRVQGAAR